ncbi:MAG: hypothetical protein M1419_03185, partial [Bacteroidetes bacterium]|nr:hypothetical protein [Bacteroidota bacterium]
LIFISSAYLCASIIRDAFSELLGVGKNELFGIAYSIYISSLLFLINYLNGLETGLLILSFLLFIRFYQKSQILNFKNITVLGIILGLMVLIRIDTVYFVIVFSISLFFRKEITLKTRLIYVITICIVSFLISSPWWFYNYYYFNSLMPTSGQAQFEFGIFFSRLFYLSDAWVQNLTPFTYTFDRFLHGWISVIIRLIIIGAMSYYLKKYFKGIIKNTSKSNKLSERTYQIISVIFVYSLILTIWYFFFSSAGHFYLRYLISLSIIGQIFFVIFVTIIYRKFKKIFYFILTAFALLILGVVILFHTELMLNKSQFFKYQLQLVNKYVPKTEYVGAGQSGTLGFFRNHVVNLDGKVNNEALKYKEKIYDYLDKKNINWLCDWKFYTEQFLGPEHEKRGWKLVSRYYDFYLYHKSTE